MVAVEVMSPARPRSSFSSRCVASSIASGDRNASGYSSEAGVIMAVPYAIIGCAQPPVPSWGNMLNNAQDYLVTAPWLAILPGAAITLAVTGSNFLGDGLRDALDPRLDIR